MARTRFLLTLLLGLAVPLGSAGAAAADEFRVGDIVEARVRGGPNEPWDPKLTFQVRIIEVNPNAEAQGVAKYKVRMLTAEGGSRDGYAFPWQVRRLQGRPVQDQYTPEFLYGAWDVGPGSNENTVSERDNGDGTRTRTIERSLIGNSNRLEIYSNQKWSWRVAGNKTLRGDWVAGSDPDYPIVLRRAYWDLDWLAGPFGKHDGKEFLRLKSLPRGAVSNPSLPPGPFLVSGPRIGPAQKAPAGPGGPGKPDGEAPPVGQPGDVDARIAQLEDLLAQTRSLIAKLEGDPGTATAAATLRTVEARYAREIEELKARRQPSPGGERTVLGRARGTDASRGAGGPARTPSPERQSASAKGRPRALKVGDRVEAESRDGAKYHGTVVGVEGDRYHIQYDDARPYYREWVTADKVRPRPASQ